MNKMITKIEHDYQDHKFYLTFVVSRLSNKAAKYSVRVFSLYWSLMRAQAILRELITKLSEVYF